MARKKDENREKAKQLFLDSEGIMSNPEIAEALGVDSAKVRKWKCIDKWNEALENKPKKKGRTKRQPKRQRTRGPGTQQKRRNTRGIFHRVF